MHRLLARLRPAWLRHTPSCQLCRAPGGELAICTGCEADLPWLTGQCVQCALPLPTQGLPCGDCLKRPPAFDRVEAPWRYAFPLDSLVTRFKHQGRWPLGRLLGEMLARHLAHAFDEGLPRPACLLPVPLAAPRLRRRGFNQAQMLARWLGDELRIPVQDSWLRRITDSPSQQDLDAAARRRNLRNAFDLGSQAQVAGLHLALVDDVLTTGTTAHLLARLLKRAGAARVDVYCLARTPRPGDR
ncbi:ComF family protein [Metapseudomonas resinovorans]|uniref:Competence protein ComF homolog n=1 Tax=Metapseudomonas resinovorans NBRC 106553 TaxID=1245471 RepID=S6ALF9_METRE|nr:ComF family protein [Pseudomonas resinovorans]BAN46203.1 competence protein ComF homolog [Pseudomonas resinovorans NBRC 106553]